MTSHRFLRTGITLIALFAFSVQLAAQDKITFTWVKSWRRDRQNIVNIKATTGKEFIVDWGDSTVETRMGTGDTIVLSHTYVEGKYEVTILASNTDCRFTFFDCSGYDNGDGDDENKQISTLTLVGCSALTELRCGWNELTNLDVSSCKALQSMYCSNNELTNLNISGCKALQELDCSHNQLTNLDVSNLSALRSLQCSHNQLTNLDVSNLSALQSLWCKNNQLTNLDVIDCKALQELGCYNNQLTNLDVSNLSALQSLWCSYNQLTNLDASNCKALKYLSCSNNQLTNLNVSNCKYLWSLECHKNKLQLSYLFAAYLMIDTKNNELGTQNLLPQTVFVGEELFSDQSIFNGIFTSYTIKNSASALQSDYTSVDGKLTFNAVGNYIVRMTNDAIVSHSWYPAEVIVEITVVESVPETNSETQIPFRVGFTVLLAVVMIIVVAMVLVWINIRRRAKR